MTPRQRPVAIPRHDPVPRARQTNESRMNHRSPAPTVDPSAGQLLRGLVFGLPIGLTMWLLLMLLVWHFT